MKNQLKQIAMKKTIRLMLMLLIAASMLTFNSCNKEKVLPEKITVSGYVTYDDGQPFEDVHVSLYSNTFMGPNFPLGETIYTDELGHYEVEFKPDKDYTYRLNFQSLKDGHQYYHDFSVTKWEAVQEHNVVWEKIVE